jgi:hypothetical protein
MGEERKEMVYGLQIRTYTHYTHKTNGGMNEWGGWAEGVIIKNDDGN